MPFSRRRRSPGPTPLAHIAERSGLVMTTRTWLERTVSDVAFDRFVFGHDMLCTQPGALDAGPSEGRGALERGTRADGVTLAVGSMPWRSTRVPWIAAQSRRGENHLELDERPLEQAVGHEAFDDAFDLDADDEAMELVRSVLTPELCDWAVEADRRHGPLIVIFDGPEAASDDVPAHGTTVFVAREVAGDDAFVETMAITIELVTELLRATQDR